MLRLLSLARRIPRNWDPLLSGRSVAVMPLGNLTGDPGQEYFAAGLTEELTHELARFQGLRVIASHSTFQMKGVKGGCEDGHGVNCLFHWRWCSAGGDGKCLHPRSGDRVRRGGRGG